MSNNIAVIDQWMKRLLWPTNMEGAGSGTHDDYIREWSVCN